MMSILCNETNIQLTRSLISASQTFYKSQKKNVNTIEFRLIVPLWIAAKLLQSKFKQ